MPWNKAGAPVLASSVSAVNKGRLFRVLFGQCKPFLQGTEPVTRQRGPGFDLNWQELMPAITDDVDLDPQVVAPEIEMRALASIQATFQ